MAEVNTFSFLSGGGEMGERTRNFDWSQTPVGSPDTWPQSLRSTVSIIINSKFPMFLWWGQDLIQFYNDAYRPSMGNDGKHPLALGQRGEECWPEIWPIIKPLIDQVLLTGDPTWSENQLIPIYRNGHLEDVYWTFGYSPVKDDAGSINGVLVICNETTEHVANYQKVEESKEQLEFAIDATELATWDFNPINNTFTANRRYTEWFGLTAQQATANALALQIIADEDRQRVIDAYQKAIWSSTKAKYDIEYKIRPEGKPERTLRAKGKAWFNGGETAYRFTGTLQDVTDQVNTRHKIEESENRFRSLIEEAPIATSLLVGRELKIEVANQAVLDLWGKGNDVIGKTLQEAIPELQGQHFLKTLDDVFTSGKGFSTHADPTMLVVDDKEQQFYFDFTNKPVFDEEGKVWAILSMGVDVTDQVLSVKKLEDSEQQVLSFIESAPFPIGVYVGKEMRIQLANQTMLDTWGKGDNVIGKLYSDILPELDNQQIFEQLESVYTTGKPFHAKNQRVDLFVDGKLRPYYFNYSFTPLFNKGEVYGVMNTAANVTELNIAHQRVNESENNLRNVILQAPVAMCILKGENFVVEIANDRMLELWGKTFEDMIAKPLFEALYEVKGQGFEEMLDNVYHKGETVRSLATPVTLPRKEGIEIVYVDFVYEAFRNAVTEEISGVMVIAVDVSDQVVARKKIEESEERARLAVESAELGTYEVNLLDGHLIASSRLDEIFDVEHSTERERYVSSIHPEDLKIREQAYELGLKTGILEYISRVVWKDGSIHWIRVKGRILHGDSNTPIRLLGVVQDITEQKLFEAELNRQVKERTVELENKNRQLENINQELEQFTYAASHDMQEPLRKVNTFTSFLLENHAEQLDERGKNYLDRISASVSRMKNIIDDLLNYSYQTREEQQPVSTDLNQIIRDVEADLEVIIEQKNATVFKDNFPAIVAVPAQINQLLSNLISNALKFTKPGEPVEIQIKNKTVKGSEVMRNDLDPQQQYLMISVIDNGIGFDQQYAEQVFGLFKRLHGKNDFAGTGIGLGLCKKIVQNHEGAIWAESELGKGSAFHVLLPMNSKES